MTSSAQLQPEPPSAGSQLGATLAELLGNTARAGQECAAAVQPVPLLLLRPRKEHVSLSSLNVKSVINHEPPCTMRFCWITDSIFCYMLKRERIRKLIEKINN